MGGKISGHSLSTNNKWVYKATPLRHIQSGRLRTPSGGDIGCLAQLEWCKESTNLNLRLQEAINLRDGLCREESVFNGTGHGLTGCITEIWAIMNKTIVVVVGEWECSEQGCWNFVVEKDVMAQCIVIDDKMSFKNMKAQIEHEFEVPHGIFEANISFWMPAELSVFTTTTAPPVCIKSDTGVKTFLEARETRKGLNLCVSFASCNGVDLNKMPSQFEKGEASMRRMGTVGIKTGNINETVDECPAPQIGGNAAVGEKDRVSAAENEAEESEANSGNIIRLGDPTPPEFDVADNNDVGGDGAGQSEGDRCEFEKWRNNDNWINGTVRHTAGTPTSEDGIPATRFQHEAVPEGDGVTIPVTGSLNGEPNDVQSGNAEATQSNVCSRREGKRPVSENGNEDNDSDTCIEVMNLSDSEGDYDFDYWDQLIERENNDPDLVDYALVPEGRGTSNFTNTDQVVPEHTDTHIRSGLGPVRPVAEERGRSGEVENRLSPAAHEGSGQTSKEGDGEALDVNCTVAEIYRDIRDAGILPTKDAPPVFEDQYILTGQMAPMDFEETDDGIYIGRVFTNKAEMQHILAMHAIKRMFNFKLDKSDTKRIIVSCVDKNCTWRVFGHIISPNSENIQIRTARLIHTCDVSTRSQFGKRASARVIAQVLKEKYTHAKKGPRAVEIPDIVQSELRVNISYMKAWYAKEIAVEHSRGTEEASYKLLMGYMHVLAEKNPGTVYEVEAREDSNGQRRFKYLFFALGASIAAIPYLRKVIVIDGTTIKGKFQGCMLTASYQDGNFQCFPIAFGVVDGENEDAWTWFFRQLSRIVPDAKDLMFVSDRHTSIYPAMKAVYPKANHGACCVHLYRNVKAHFRGEGLGYLVSRAARAYTVGSFKYWFKEIETRSPGCAEYLLGIGLDHWTQICCPGKRYNLTSTNIAESLNSALAKVLELPIVSMVEGIRMMLMQWFYWRRTKAAKVTTRLTPEVENIIMNHLKDSGGHTVIPSSTWVFQVNTEKGKTYTLNLEDKTCTCRVFQTLMIPCSHAIAAARYVGLPITPMADSTYTIAHVEKIYGAIIMPVPDMEDEEVPPEAQDPNIINPETARGSGRPRKRRIPSAGDTSRKRQKTRENCCSRCSQPGHNKVTCKNPIN